MEIKTEKIKYIENNKQYGIVIDWQKAHRYFNKITYAKNKYNGNRIPWTRYDIHWLTLMSERGTGKTTTIVLMGMILNKMYGSTIAYMRQFKDETTAKYYNEMFNVILQYDYIEQITDGIYNDIHVERTTKRVFYCHKDENGKIDLLADKPFMYILAVENAMSAKSTFNAPNCSIILFDEFASDKYISSEYSGFELLNTWISTIRRDRMDLKIFMLANTLNPYNKYLDELNVSKKLIEMRKGDTKIIDGGLGALVYVEFIDNVVSEKVNNKLLRNAIAFHGFKNPKLKAIYGGDWSIRNYPHLWRDDMTRIDNNNIYIECMGSMINVELWEYNADIIVNMSMSYRTADTVKNDAIILSDLYDITNNRVYGMHTILKNIHDCEITGRLYFSDNGVGLLWDTFKQHLRNIK